MHPRTKSNAAIFRLAVEGGAGMAPDALYRPISSVSRTMRHVICSGSFFDSGVKKLATALPRVLSGTL